MSYEYKTVGAPEKGKRRRGSRSRSDRVAAAFDEILAEEAVDGWEYMRTDLVPVTERNGLFGRAQEVHRAVMVFRRELEPVRPNLFAAPEMPEPALRSVPAPAVVPPAAVKPAEPVGPRTAPADGEEAELRLARFIRQPRTPEQRD